MDEIGVLDAGLPVAAAEIAAMELGGVPVRRDGRGVRLTPVNVKEFRTIGRSRMIDAFWPDLVMPCETTPKGRGDTVTGASVDISEVMVRLLIGQGLPLERARNQADVADANEAAKHRKGRRREGPRLIVRRQRRRPKMIYVKHGSQRITTHMEARPSEDFRMHPGALAVLADYVEMVVRRILGRVERWSLGGNRAEISLQFTAADGERGRGTGDVRDARSARISVACLSAAITRIALDIAKQNFVNLGDQDKAVDAAVYQYFSRLRGEGLSELHIHKLFDEGKTLNLRTKI